ncbi:MAG: DUF2442 domain-containing protein [Pseudomonadota bacterium]
MTTSAPDLGLGLAAGVRASDTAIEIELRDGRTLSVPLSSYPRLLHATPRERQTWRLIGDGRGIHWPDIEEDVSVEGLIAGRRSRESAASFNRWPQGRRQ